MAGPQESYFGAERILVWIVGGLQFMGQTAHAQAGYLGKAFAADTQMVGIGMGGVPLRRQAQPPLLIGINQLGLVVKILTLRYTSWPNPPVLYICRMAWRSS